jgi:hypothetical protein
MGIDILSGAQDDLDDLSRSDPEAFATIMAFLQEAAADSKLLEKWTTHGDAQINDKVFSVKRWVEGRRIGELYRIRILDTPATSYRIVYGYHWPLQLFGILAVVHKSQLTYEINDPLADRIRDDWTGSIDEFY